MKLVPVAGDPFADPTMGRDLYVIRHGATALNAQNGNGSVDRIRGWTDVPLSEKGRAEAKDLAAELADSGIDALYYSTLSRAADTAHDIAKTTGARTIPDADLRPWNLGDFTGKESATVLPQMREFVIQKPDRRVPGGESFNAFKLRVFTAINKLMNETSATLPAIVTHHRVERLLAAWDKKGQPSDLSIDYDEMLKKGEAPASARLMKFRPLGGKMRLEPVEQDPFRRHGWA